MLILTVLEGGKLLLACLANKHDANAGSWHSMQTSDMRILNYST